MKKTQAILLLCLWLGLTGLSWLMPPRAFSDAERRPLTQMPSFSLQSLEKGSFMSDFEAYTLDQFPLRDRFRTLKSLFHYGILGQKDNNGIYLHEGYAAKQEYPLKEESLAHALARFEGLREKYLMESDIYMAIVPDKGYYLAEESGQPAMDYAALQKTFREGMPWATHINLTDKLSLQDYYRTDTHWQQHRILEAAKAICGALGVTAPQAEDYRVTELEKPFYGVYYGQAALPMEPDSICILENELLAECRVFDQETGKTLPVYDLSRLDGKDPYEIYLSGPKSLLTIENPRARTDRELIVFRDSFGSAMIPLILQDYAKVTVIDIRYIQMDLLDRFVEFKGQDVLFLYSTLVLNKNLVK